MPPHVYISGFLLCAAVLLSFLCSLGLLVMRDPYQRLHYTTPIVSVAILLIAVSICIEDPAWQARIKSGLIVLILFFTNAILSHATARAIRIRNAGTLAISEDDKITPSKRPRQKIASKRKARR